MLRRRIASGAAWRGVERKIISADAVMYLRMKRILFFRIDWLNIDPIDGVFSLQLLLNQPDRIVKPNLK
jgi:hypothetical protein|tara:strand:- start:63 stop:269 length:207 start_codon:yes stop_codon:yes gene_type:complete